MCVCVCMRERKLAVMFLDYSDECDQISFIFQTYSPLQSTQFFLQSCSAWIPQIKKLSTTDMTSSYELFSPPSCIPWALFSVTAELRLSSKVCEIQVVMDIS